MFLRCQAVGETAAPQTRRRCGPRLTSLVLPLLFVSCVCGGGPQAPQPEAVEPGWAIAGAATTVTIHGRDFWLGIRVSYGASSSSEVRADFGARLGDVELLDVRWVDSQTLTAIVPATLGRGVHDLTVIDPQQRTGVLPAAFSVVSCSNDSDCSADCHATAVCHDGVCLFGAIDCQRCGDGELCDDGTLCTRIDSCQGGVCSGGDPVVCSALDPCHDAGTCDPLSGACSDPIRPLLCGDSAVCGDEVCDDGTNDGSLGHCGRECRSGPPAALSFLTQPSPTVVQAVMAPPVAVSIVDAAGRQVRGASQSITLALDTDPTAGRATLSGQGPLAALDGVATFPALALDTAAVGYRLNATAQALTLAVSTPFTVSSADPWSPPLDGWQYRKQIVVPSRSPSTVLSDFPVLINHVDAELRAGALATGHDIAFATISGALLHHQVERFDSSTGRLVAWVKLPVLDTSIDTIFYLYYGQPSASVDPSVTTVWSNGFVAVWHLDETGSGAGGEYVDASGNGNDGTGGAGATSATPAHVPAQVAGGQDFDGTADFIRTTPSLLDGRTRLSMTMWANVRRSDQTASPGLLGQNDVLELGFYWPDRINLWAANIATICPGKLIASLCTPNFTLGSWFLLTVTWDGVYAVMFVDGVEQHRVPLIALGSSPYPFNIGGGGIFDESGNNFDGMVDEVRVAAIDRSPEWFAIEYANQSAPELFYVVGIAEAHP